MTVTLQLVQDTDTAAFAHAADAWAGLAAALDDRLDEFVADSRDLSTLWPTGTRAEQRTAALRIEIADTYQPVLAVSQALRAHADTLWQLQGLLDTVLAECAADGVTVDLATATATAAPGGVTDTAQAARMPGLVRGYNEQLRDLAGRAARLDEQTRAVLRSCLPTAGAPGAGPGFPTCTALDEVAGKSPAQVHDWWQSLSLSRAQQDQLIRDFPQRVGALDGVPATDRDEANRNALQQQKQHVLDRLDVGTGDPDALREQVERIHKIEDTLKKLGDRGYLLDVDTEAYDGHGTVAIAVGNPDTSRHTGVWVPGLSTTLYGAMDDNIDRIMRMNEAADKLTRGYGGDICTVYWLGYDAPDLDNTSVLGNSHSEAGRDPYLSFMNGLRATHQGEAGHLVAMGHSYGSTVVGEAARTGALPVDDIVVAGSPGMHVDHAGQLHSDSRHVWAGAAGNDPVADTPMVTTTDRLTLGAAGPGLGLTLWGLESAADATHGDAPTTPGFGANTWVTDTSGHTHYWEPDSQSLYNQSRVLAGAYDQVTLTHGVTPENLR